MWVTSFYQYLGTSENLSNRLWLLAYFWARSKRRQANGNIRRVFRGRTVPFWAHLARAASPAHSSWGLTLKSVWGREQQLNVMLAGQVFWDTGIPSHPAQLTQWEFKTSVITWLLFLIFPGLAELAVLSCTALCDDGDVLPLHCLWKPAVARTRGCLELERKSGLEEPNLPFCLILINLHVNSHMVVVVGCHSGQDSGRKRESS